ncbi:hypothetical protein IHE55_14105 [Streptomyces pactum]|uniref:Uncharacterized protein n=1 Tax=Streptomyces pactum TaxID=68249 RepID=A0ABS0NKY1_9ACTN|nr:hypothetical protein [Streptomyces pactum]MBH5335858.1 hypothetical protein [Streptomyces pactum]
MSSAEQTAGPPGEPGTPQKPGGTTSLVVGAAAVTMLGFPSLPESVPPWFRFLPLYFIVPAGICAMVLGAVALRDLRTPPATGRSGRRRARAGLVLGAVAVVIPLAVIVRAYWQLGQASG